jgi:lipopolysaccharide transport system permease protein
MVQQPQMKAAAQQADSPMNAASQDTQFAALPTVTVRGADSPWTVQWRELWQHRELLYFLIWRDIKVRYKQTVIGVAWAVLQPVAIALSLSLLLGRLLKVPAGELPYPVFAYSGMVFWQLFSQAMTESSNSLVANERLLTKVYFPRLLIPLSAVLASVLDFAFALLVLVFFLTYFRIVPHSTILLLPFFVLLTVLIALGIGLWLSALNVKYRDVRYTVTFLVQFWFLATPIAYPSSAVPERWRLWYALNPMVGVVDGFRWSLRGSGAMPLRVVGISICAAAALLVSGLYYFRRTEDTFADYI